MKRVLIISPHFPPVNAADMHRIRMSLPYYRSLGWEPVIIASDETYVEGLIDPYLNETIPADIEIHKVKAWPVVLTRKVGVGSLSIRSYYYFKKKGNELLSQRKFDLVFFSTSMFHVCALGRYWKKKFNIPFVVDMQDPWRNDFYLDKPRAQRPPKFLFAHAINKTLEAYTMPYADGIIAVSQAYITHLQKRYPALQNRATMILPFGTSAIDFELVRKKQIMPEFIQQDNGKINVVYVGTLTSFFLVLIKSFFISFQQKVADKEKYHFYFIGTNYKKGKIEKPIQELAVELNMISCITEIPYRIPYFSAIATLMHSDILFIPGSMDADYNASKIYHNLLTGNPIFSIYHEQSLVKKTIDELNAGIVVGINEHDNEEALVEKISAKMDAFASLHNSPNTNISEAMKKYSAPELTKRQVDFFNKIIMNRVLPILNSFFLSTTPIFELL